MDFIFLLIKQISSQINLNHSITNFSYIILFKQQHFFERKELCNGKDWVKLNYYTSGSDNITKDTTTIWRRFNARTKPIFPGIKTFYKSLRLFIS